MEKNKLVSSLEKYMYVCIYFFWSKNSKNYISFGICLVSFSYLYVKFGGFLCIIPFHFVTFVICILCFLHLVGTNFFNLSV